MTGRFKDLGEQLGERAVPAARSKRGRNNHVGQEKTKVMQLTRSLNVGGLEKLVALFARKLDPKTFEVSVCCLLRKGFFADELEKDGVKIHLIKDEDTASESRFLFLKLARLLRKERPDILHTHNTHPMIDGTLAGRMARVPIIVHTDHARSFPDRTKYMVIENILSRFVHRIVAVSEFSKQQLVHFEKIKPAKIAVIANGVNFARRQYDRSVLKRAFGVAGASPIIGAVSRLTEQKGTKYLIAAMPAILRAYPGAVLMVVGDGVLRHDLEEQVQELQIESNVRFYGYQKEVEKYIQAMDLLVSPSIWEGMPLGILEVMQCGKPIVATRVGGVPEVVEDGVTGILTDSKSPQELADAVIEMVGREGFIQMAGDAAITRYRENFTEEIMLAKYERLYMDLLARTTFVII